MDNLSSAKGANLEQQMATYFRLNGYDVDTNVRLEGRSGARHEIDVLAKKSDGITEFVLALECKAWAEPIEKDVVSKLSMVISDTGINKGIIVALQGWRSGAEKTAIQEKIELWGPDELIQRLGSVALAELNMPTNNRYSIDVISEARASEPSMRAIIDGETRGLLGLGREDEVWAKLIWIPFHLLELHQSTLVKEFLRKPTVKVTPVWAMHNALNDAHFITMSVSPTITSEQAESVIPPKTKAKAIAANFVSTLKKFHEVTTDSAKVRYREKLIELGLSANLENLSVENVSLVHHPFFVGLFHRRGNDRFVAVDAYTGKLDEAMSQTLTENLSYVDSAVNPQ